MSRLIDIDFNHVITMSYLESVRMGTYYIIFIYRYHLDSCLAQELILYRIIYSSRKIIIYFNYVVYISYLIYIHIWDMVASSWLEFIVQSFQRNNSIQFSRNPPTNSYGKISKEPSINDVYFFVLETKTYTKRNSNFWNSFQEPP